MKTKTSFVAASIFLISNVYAQQRFSFSANAGVGKMNSSAEVEEFSSELTTTKSKYRPTFGFNVNYSYRFSNFSVETGMGYLMLNGKKNEFFELQYLGEPYSDRMNAETLREAHYLRVPLFVNYHLQKLNFGIGASVSYLLTNKQTFNLYRNDLINLTVSKGNNLATFDAGFNAQVSYEFSKNMAVEMKMYIGLVDISNGTENGAFYDLYQGNPIDGQLKNQQLTLGIRYFLRKDQTSN